ncbi:MAG: hypothetical protein KJ638_07915 [Chloroflexi bacterium]|nr:hypothetical protein [Chloroflexota bacterium]
MTKSQDAPATVRGGGYGGGSIFEIARHLLFSHYPLLKNQRQVDDIPC